MDLLRRFLVLAALLFWVGGFTFYGAVVVPVGRHEIGGEQQARVTRPVTAALNWAGACALAPFAWDVVRGRDPSRRRRALRWACWAALAATLVVLFLLHNSLARHMDAGLSATEASFRTLHRAYLLVGTAQWLAALAYAAASVTAWRAEDGALAPAERAPDHDQQTGPME